MFLILVKTDGKLRHMTFTILFVELDTKAVN